MHIRRLTVSFWCGKPIDKLKKKLWLDFQTRWPTDYVRVNCGVKERLQALPSRLQETLLDVLISGIKDI